MNKPNYVEQWLNDVAYENSRSRKTESEYERVWAEFEKSTGLTAEEIIQDYENVEKNQTSERPIMRKYAQIIGNYRNEASKRGAYETTLRTYVGVITSFFRHNDLPLGHISQAKAGTLYHNKDITKEEITTIMAQVGIREKAFFAIMAQSGLRPVTIAQLTIENVENILSPETKLPCKITVPREKEKGKFLGHPTFIGEEAVKYTKQYLTTRKDLKPESLLFSAETDETHPVITKNISRTFRREAQNLQKTGAIKYKIRKGKPSELRLYTLRKYFRKYANQMGFEHVNYLMGHKTKGSDQNYTPKDDEFYRELYEKQAMPFLRFETPTPTETNEIINTLKEQHQKEIETIENKHKQADQELRERLAKLESTILTGEDRLTYRKWQADHPEEAKQTEDRQRKREQEYEELIKKHPEEAPQHEPYELTTKDQEQINQNYQYHLEERVRELEGKLEKLIDLLTQKKQQPTT